jgi:hypothetical protein
MESQTKNVPTNQNKMQIGDGISGMAKLADVDMILTDIPSGKTRPGWDVLPDLNEFFDAAWSALKPSGVLAIIVSHLDVAAKLVVFPHYRFDLVWEKSIATGFLMAKSRPLKSHEHVLIFYRELPKYNVQMESGHTPIHAATKKSHGENYGEMTKQTKSRAGSTDRFPRSVLKFASVGTTAQNRAHPQQKPTDLLAWLIKSYSDEGDLIVDPFAGSGSCGVAAAGCGRSFIGWEIRAEI